MAAGRRSGKTEDAKRIILAGDEHHRGALSLPDASTPPNQRFGIFGPTRDQLKRNWWDDIKAMSPMWAVAAINEDELSIRFWTGAKLYLIGLDKPQRAEGDPFDGVVLDESQEVKPSGWESSVRPTLTNRGRPPGWSLRIGRPKGRNHFYKWWTEAKTAPDHDAFHWPSSAVLPAEMLEREKATMDPRTYAQEFEADWVTFEGLAYHCWDPNLHYRALDYVPSLPLVVCFDFNVDPGICDVLQEQNHAHADTNGEKVPTTCAIGEVHITPDSNTERVCRRFIKDWGHHQGDVLVYGDPSGGSRSANSDTTNWKVVREMLGAQFGDRVRWRVARKAPDPIDRVACVNSRMRSTSGRVRFLADPRKNSRLIADFEGIFLLKGGSGEINKKGAEDAGLSHHSEATGYYVHEKFPVGGGKNMVILNG